MNMRRGGGPEDDDTIDRTIGVLVVTITVAGLLTTSTYPGVYSQVPTGFETGTLVRGGYHKPSFEQWFRALNSVSFMMSLVTICSALGMIVAINVEGYTRLRKFGRLWYGATELSLVITILAAYAAAILAIFLYISTDAGVLSIVFSFVTVIFSACALILFPCAKVGEVEEEQLDTKVILSDLVFAVNTLNETLLRQGTLGREGPALSPRVGLTPGGQGPAFSPRIGMTQKRPMNDPSEMEDK
jgi:hypothetical protein